MRQITDILGPIAVGSFWFFICLSILGLSLIHCPLWLSIVLGIPAGSFLGVVFVGLIQSLLFRVFRNKASFDQTDLESSNLGVNLIEGIIVPVVGLLILTAILVPVFIRVRQNVMRDRQHHPVHSVHPIANQ
jgi:hypothetical protein